ncbi:MAG: glycosyltransferase family 4 protein [Clostridia bacterium]|nr:glycosyltransferase family 4 protein [Clostridia bacterium]
MIPKDTYHTTPAGSKVHVYYPRYVSASSKIIGSFNTGIISESLFEKAAIKQAKKIKKKFDFVYGHFFLCGGLAAAKIGKLLSLPSFVAYGECDYNTEIIRHYRELHKDEVSSLSGIIAVSTKNANELKSKGIFDDIPMIVCPNATDHSLFYVKDKTKCRNKFGLPHDKFIVAFVGGFIERKGDKRLLEAINSIDGVYGIFAGRGDDKPTGDKVLYCDALEHKDVCDFLCAADVFCLPTLGEGSCNAVVEAMSCGKAIISSDLPFNDDALNAENSIRVNPNSVDEIREAIRILYEDSQLCSRIADKALADSKNFEIEARAEKILGFIINTTKEIERNE